MILKKLASVSRKPNCKPLYARLIKTYADLCIIIYSRKVEIKDLCNIETELPTMKPAE